MYYDFGALKATYKNTITLGHNHKYPRLIGFFGRLEIEQESPNATPRYFGSEIILKTKL